MLITISLAQPVSSLDLSCIRFGALVIFFLAPKWGLKRRAVYDQKEKETFKKNHKSEKKRIKKLKAVGT